MATEQKITYTTMSLEQADAFNSAYDQALRDVRRDIGRTYPVYAGGEAMVVERATFESCSPADTRLVLGTFQECREAEVDAAVRAARSAWPAWSRLPWPGRVAVLRGVAGVIRSRKYELGAWLTLEAGKPRLESIGEVEEAADLIDTYCDQVEEHDGYVIRMHQLSPNEINHSVLRPYGVFGVIAPFNFPIALATGMLAGALAAGNTVVFKPSIETPLTGLKVYECFAEAGVPAGIINLVTGAGNETGEAITNNPGIDGIAFIGSKRVGTHIYREFSRERPRPCIAEMGGKNPVIVTDRADLSEAVEGTARAAFGYSGQKCSAASRVYVHEAVADEFVHRLTARTREIAVGDPAEAGSFIGPVINRAAYDRYAAASEEARRDGTVMTGGEWLTGADFRFGYYCAPTLVRLPPGHRFFREELFVPLLCVATVASLDEALTLANDSEYGLTAGLFSEDDDEIAAFFERIEAGVVYANRAAGATTGAWPGVQSFGGWKASGSTGKSALGPYYVAQFMHEQNQTIVRD